ncbi:hypothetical protein B7724_00375 [Streptococcus oralis subsp. tigurinus]|uniref:DUF859 family phage minor structural protein n=1 Tax=Streptococcus oralis TaxID=1303 RepID=UPI000A11B4FC|nr:DUF859 family phage minor structural protein [Streptococcus oralis]ORO50375.1 hypothetical protein B7724_00375 [Streptococcus oralis subsp. tigurinus]
MAKYSNSSGSLFLNVYIDQDAPNIAANTTTVNWEMTVSRSSYYHTFNKSGSSTLSLSLDGRNVHSSNPTWEVWDGEVTLAKGSSTIVHNVDGSKTLPLSCTFNPNNGYHESITVTANISLTPISRASSVSVNAGTIGSPITISISRHSSSFKHTVRYVWGNKSGTIASNVDTSTTWMIPLDFANEIPNSTSGSGMIYVDTYAAGTKTGTQSTILTASIPTNMKPTLSNVTLTDANGVARGLLNGNNFLQIVSDIQVGFNGASGVYGSTITGYRAEIVNKNHVVTENGGRLGMMNFNGSATIRASVVDSRGRQSDARDITINVIEYFAPSLSFTAVRTRESPNIIQIIRNAKIAPLMLSGKQRNNMTLTFRVAPLNANNFSVDNGSASGVFTTIHTLTNSAANLAGNYPATKSFTVIGRLEDKFTSVEFSATVATESVIMSYDKDGRVGVGKVAELGQPGSLDVLGDIYSRNKPIQQHQITQSNGKVLDATGDWNNYINTGMYMGSNLLNSPSGGNPWKHIQVFKHNDNWVVQVAYDFSGQFLSVRSKTNGIWNNWVEYATVTKTVTRKIDGGWGVKLNATRNGNTVTLSTEHVSVSINTDSDYRELRETLPAGFRPASEAHLILQGHSDSTVSGTAILHLATDGKIRLTSKSPGNKFWVGTISYITSDPYP